MPEETVPYRVGDQEVPLPLSALQQIAERIGYDNAAAVVNQLRNGAEAQEIIKQARTIYQNARQRSQQYAQPQQPPVDQRWQQHLAAQQQRQQPQDPDDPLQMLSEMRAEIRQLREQQMAREQMAYQRETQKLEREANTEYAKFKSELLSRKIPEWKIPDRDYLLAEAEMLGMFHGDTSIGEMYRNVYKMMNADALIESAASNAVQSHVERLRDPRAKVTVPVARPAPAQPQAQGIDSMKIGDILPDGKY